MYTRTDLLRLVLINSGYTPTLELLTRLIRKDRRAVDTSIVETFGKRLQPAAMGRYFIV